MLPAKNKLPPASILDSNIVGGNTSKMEEKTFAGG